MQHIIIGAGPAGVIAAETLRKAQPGASILIIGEEPDTPYSRMALPYYLMGNIGEQGMYLRKNPNCYIDHKIDLWCNRVTSIDRRNRSVTLANGDTMDYAKLLIATGSQPITPKVSGIDQPGVHTCWTLADGRAIAATAKPGTRVVLMGAGFIGCIILEALVRSGVELTVVEMGNRMVPRMMDDTAGTLLKRWCQAKGVTVHTSAQVEAIESEDRLLQVRLATGETLAADMVIQATGVKPNVAFLENSGLEIELGIRVDDHLRTNDDHIYAAGDVAEGKDFSSGGYSVQAIQPTAADHGRIAALNMAGRDVRHQGSVNMNVLDTIGLISCSFGLWDGVDGGDSAVLQDSDRYRYLNLQFQEDRLIGASCLGLINHVGVLRGLIQSQVRLGDWAKRLQQNPTRLMEAYIACTQAIGGNAYVFNQSALSH